MGDYVGRDPVAVNLLRDYFSGNGSQTSFTLNYSPSNSKGILVLVNGVVQPADTTAYSVTGLVLTFVEAPAFPAPGVTNNIEVIYLALGTSDVAAGGGRGGPSATITGFTVSNSSGDPTNDFDFAPGQCMDSLLDVELAMNSALTGKQLDVIWAEGSNAGLADNPTASSPVTLDPANKQSLVILSNGNMTAEGRQNTILSTGPVMSNGDLKSTGKWYFEVTLVNNVTGTVTIGFAKSTFDPNGGYFLGQESHGFAYASSGPFYYNSTNPGTVQASYGTAGTVIGIAIDFGTNTISCFKNNVSTGTPYASFPTGSGPWRPAVDVWHINNASPPDKVTVNFGATAFTYTPPTGYLPWTRTSDTTWHLYAIRKTANQNVDVIASISNTTPALPSGYETFRRIASIPKVGGANTLISQQGNEFLLKTTVPAITSVVNPGITAASRPIAYVPSGITTFAIVRWALQNTGTTATSGLVTALSVNDDTPSVTNCNLGPNVKSSTAGFVGAAVTELITRTDTGAQVRTRLSASDANTTLSGQTVGWIDERTL